ncbi:MAG: (2Fe-2S)-binding protein [Pseudomonadota bacterium]|nr:(2Fe-2S)-binding protein [Pseudomonadota bacterium]
MYVCICNAVTEHDIREAADAGCASVAEMTMRTGAGSNCGSCLDLVAQMIGERRAVRELSLPMLQAA